MQNVRNYLEIKAKEIVNPVQCTVLTPIASSIYFQSSDLTFNLIVCTYFVYSYVHNLFAFIAKNVQAGNFI